MSLTITLTPGAVVTEGDVWTVALLNAIANPTIALEGSVGVLALADNSVTTPKLLDGLLTADSTGRAKMADLYVTLAKINTGIFTADVTGRGKFASSFVNTALIEDGAVTGPKLHASAASVVAGCRNLLLFNNAGTPNSKVDVTADEVVLKDASGKPYLTAVNVTVDITASGANGLDTGAEGASTWYYVWIIYNGTTVAGLLSASATAPTLPGAYTYKGLVGAVRNNGSSNFDTVYQQDRVAYVNETAVVVTPQTGPGTAYAVLSGTGATTMGTTVPPIAKWASGVMGSTSTTNTHGIVVAGDANGVGACAVAGQPYNTAGAIGGFRLGGGWRVALRTAQLFYWKTDDTSSDYRVTVSSYGI